MTNKGKGSDHINAKDMADEAVLKIRYLLDELKQSINFASYKMLYEKSNETNVVWYKYQNAHLTEFKKQAAVIANNIDKKLKTAVNQASLSIGLTNVQKEAMMTNVMAGANGVYNGALNIHKATIASIGSIPLNIQPDRTLEMTRAITVHDEIAQMIQRQPAGNYGTVQYQRTGPNGTIQTVNMSWEAYSERKVRTEIQQEISTNMQAYGYQAGIVFYICAFFGDCAKDHADYQGRIYYDADWRDNIEDEALAKQIQDYITGHNLLTVQSVTSDEPYLTTRPNCRHYFQFIGIDEVLGIDTKNDLKDKREDLGLNYNGSYKPEKYEALQEQRYNERKIREFKEKQRVAELDLASLPAGTDTTTLQKKQNVVTHYEAKVKEYQAEQRSLMKKYDNLSRDYAREKPGDIYDMGA